MKKTILFDYHDLIKTNAKLSLPAFINKDSEKIPKILRDLKYPISSWPVILSKNMIKELIACCKLIPKLIHKIPELYFQNDIKRIADFYFEGDEMTAQYAVLCTQKQVDVSCRLDFIQSASGFKVLEVNAGSSIGGMELQNFETVINDFHPELVDEKLGFTTRKTQQIYIDFIIQKAMEYVVEDTEEINIFIAEMNFNGENKAKFKEIEHFYNEILNNQIVKYGKKGSVFIDKMTTVKLKNNKLTYNDKRVHAVLILNFALKNISPDVFRAFLMDTIYFPDHLGVSMLRDKRNLALLLNLATAGKFSEAENKQVLKLIPWSVLMKKSNVLFKGKEYSLITLLNEKKDEFVIKVADGLQGNNVFVGKFLSIDEWSGVIEKTLASKKYLVQEYIISDYLLAPNKNNIWKPHTIIWGAFGFGDTYGGAWVRMSDIENNTGVINSATGAVEAIVYEECTTNRITLPRQENKKKPLNTILGNEYEKFISCKNKSPLVDPILSNLPAIFKNYQYPVSSWPILIRSETAKKIAVLCEKLPRMIREIPKLYFENNVKTIADFYYKGNEMIAQFALICNEKNIDIGSRLDLTLFKDEFKILEINIGSSIGGWQVQSFEPIIRSFHSPLSETEMSNQFSSRNIQSNYINFLVEKIIKYVPKNGEEVNLFVDFGTIEDDEKKKNSLLFFNELFQKELKKRNEKGRVITGKLTALKLNQGSLSFEDKNIHGVIFLGIIKGNIPQALFRAFIMDKIYFPDHLALSMYSDKRNLQLLRALAQSGTFSEEENEMLLKSIPWTVELKDNDVIFREKEMPLCSLLLENQDKFVIKAANGYQGKNVFIGNCQSKEEWIRIINETLNSDEIFIVQEFCQTTDFFAPNKYNEWTLHKMIWGAFGFGEKYGGVWVRMSETEKNIGVINSATGAVEAIVYEIRS